MDSHTRCTYKEVHQPTTHRGVFLAAIEDPELCSLTDDGIERRSGGVYKKGKIRVGAGVGDQCDGGKGR
jgi:hypothetical protein